MTDEEALWFLDDIATDVVYRITSDEKNALKIAESALRERIERNNGWISVEDRLPEPTGNQRGFYLVALSNGVVKELAYEFKYYENMLFDVGWHETAYPVTHWMPLPAPPKEEK